MHVCTPTCSRPWGKRAGSPLTLGIPELIRGNSLLSPANQKKKKRKREGLIKCQGYALTWKESKPRELQLWRRLTERKSLRIGHLPQKRMVKTKNIKGHKMEIRMCASILWEITVWGQMTVEVVKLKRWRQLSRYTPAEHRPRERCGARLRNTKNKMQPLHHIKI